MRPVALVLRALGLGDLLTGLPALRAVREWLPDHHVMLACPAELGRLAASQGIVDEVVDAHGLARVPDIRPVDVAVNLHGRGPESHRLLMALAPNRLLAFACRAAGVVEAPAWRPERHEVARWCGVLEGDGVRAATSALSLDVVPSHAVRGARVIHPGAASAARRWPADRFAAVARHERERGRRVVVTAGRTEVELAHRVAQLGGVPRDDILAGSTSVEELAAVVAGAGRVVCGDTGVAHMATAVGTPSVVIFGPVSPALWGPPAGPGLHRVLWCGRTGDPHAARVDPGLLDVSVEAVLAELDRLPAERPGDAERTASPGRVLSYRRRARSASAPSRG